MGNSQGGKHVFVSYVREDAERVEQLCRILEAAQIPYWTDRKQLAPGDAWKQKIREAIRSGALVFIACFSDQVEGQVADLLGPPAGVDGQLDRGAHRRRGQLLKVGADLPHDFRWQVPPGLGGLGLVGDVDGADAEVLTQAWRPACQDTSARTPSNT